MGPLKSIAICDATVVVILHQNKRIFWGTAEKLKQKTNLNRIIIWYFCKVLFTFSDPTSASLLFIGNDISKTKNIIDFNEAQCTTFLSRATLN
jgi:hypothetical protein